MDLCSRSFIQIYSFLETLFENIRKELLGLWHTFLSSWFIFYPTQTRIRFWAWTHWYGHKSFNVHFQNQLFSNIKSGAHSAIGSHSKKKHIATLGPSWSFSLSESLGSLSLQDGPQSGIIITQPPHKLWLIPHKLLIKIEISHQSLMGSYQKLNPKIMGLNLSEQTQRQPKMKEDLKIL